MRLSDQTETVIYHGEQSRRFERDAASTDLDFSQIIYLTTHEDDNRDDSKVFDMVFHKPAKVVLDWAEIADAFRKPVIAPIFWGPRNLRLQTLESTFDPPPIAKNIIILGGHAPQAQSDLMVTAEEEKQFDRAETDCIEKISQVNITKRVERIFRAVAEEAMEGKIAEEFAKDLSELIRQYEDFAVCEIEHFISKEKVTSESAEAALLILGDIDHEPTHNYRRWLLEKVLIHCSSPIVRDGANVGLAYMDDPHAIPFLKKAIQNEENPLLRKVMKKTLSQLEDTQKCLSSCEVQNSTNG